MEKDKSKALQKALENKKKKDLVKMLKDLLRKSSKVGEKNEDKVE